MTTAVLDAVTAPDGLPAGELFDDDFQLDIRVVVSDSPLTVFMCPTSDGCGDTCLRTPSEKGHQWHTDHPSPTSGSPECCCAPPPLPARYPCRTLTCTATTSPPMAASGWPGCGAIRCPTRCPQPAPCCASASPRS
ncbi:FxLD family lanthipeptide [Streptomyces graminilatus]|uniref:FxLD family lanthipeptide n=1 Tax=Streptomyces graminilatus TaxID=1464070 RepID=UPI001F5226C2|nr:FxLD family lanthipeptide [Streptomyces graminilatus]